MQNDNLTLLDKTYQPAAQESHWTAAWESQGYSQPSGAGSPYCIMLPPPNVTGTLHMGHGFQHTLMDALIRFHRMNGDNTLWQAGTDHAGIATQMVVERRLAKEGISRHDLGRDKFLEKVWEWKQQSGETITGQIRRMGASIDWTRERFSMDDNISHATVEAFVRLHEEGLIYRGKRLVNWDPKFKTAISDLEVTTEAEAGHLWHLKYPVTDSTEHLIVATTRPETMLGDTAVAVHPEDERYAHLVGKTIDLPLTERKIPIIADEYVDRDFGTGCVKITPAHDFNDNEMGKRHNLPMINIMTLDAHLDDSVPEKYRGLERFEARKVIVTDFEALGLLEKVEDHQHNIPRGDRSGVVIEPLLTDQWFIKMDGMAQAAIEAHNTGEFSFIPESWNKTYLQWLENIQDWCISRQLWWGHRIPVWYDNNGNHYVGHHENDVREKYQLGSDILLTQDEDVLDTWFSAALWPFSSLGWPKTNADLKTFYPTSVLVTGFDIIFFWVARMVMLGLKLIGKVPFKEVYITGLIRDSHGQKMSKSKGNVLDPLDLVDGISLEALIEKRTTGLMQPKMEKAIIKQTKKDFPDGIESHGTDALRFTFCALANTGRNINFDMSRLAGYRNFCNKIWNAARYVLMNTEEQSLQNNANARTIADQWILTELQEVTANIKQAFRQYRFDQLAKLLYEFTWNSYCDWYLELSKCDLQADNEDNSQQASTRYTLVFVLEELMRLMHPVMPYITETIWQRVAPMIDRAGDTIMQQPYPQMSGDLVNEEAKATIEWLKQVITAIRNIRGEMHVSPAKKVHLILNKGSDTDKKRLMECAHYLKALAKVETTQWHDNGNTMPASATAVIGDLEIHIPLAGLIDKSAELQRLNKEIERLRKMEAQTEGRLQNKSFVDRAPADVVEKTQLELATCKQTLEKLEAHYAHIEAL